MSEDRVNITYSVELEKVTETVGDLINKIYNSDYRNLTKDFDTLLSHLNKQNEKQAIQTIDKIRRRLMNVDFCLGDSHNILLAYQKHLLSIEENKDVS